MQVVRRVGWTQAPKPPFPSWVTLDELLRLFVSVFSSIDRDKVSVYLVGLLGRAWHVANVGFVGYQGYIWQEDTQEECR